MSSITSRDRLLRTALGVLWAQWTELGIGGTRGTEASLVDPEVLLLATSRFARYDPRLFDEVLDWLAYNSTWLDVTRLRRLGKQLQVHDPAVLAAVIDFMQQQSSTDKWAGSARSLLANEDTIGYGVKALFSGQDGRALPTLGERDEFFLERGLERPKLELRGLSHAPDPRRRALGRLRLRALVGQGVRAEVLVFLTTNDHAHGRLVASRAGFSQRQVAEYLALLAEGGFAERWEDGRTMQYRLALAFTASLGQIAPYADWAGVWSVLTALWTAADEAVNLTSYAASKVWREALQKVRSETPVAGADLPVPVPAEYPGERILDYAEEYVLRAVEAVSGLAR